MSNVIPFDDVSLDEMRESREAVEALKGAGKDYWSAKVGENRIRLMRMGGKRPFETVSRHWVTVNTDEGSKRRVFACPRLHNRQPCPECEEAMQLKRSGNKADWQAAKEKLPRSATFCVIIDRAMEDSGPLVYAMPDGIHKTIMGYMDSSAEEPYNFFSPSEGFDIIITRTGKGQFDTEYNVRPARNPSPLGTDEQMALWADSFPDLTEFTTIMPYEEILKMLSGGTSQRSNRPAAGRQVQGPPPQGQATRALKAPASAPAARPAQGAPPSRPVAGPRPAAPAPAPSRQPLRPSPRPAAAKPASNEFTETYDESYGDHDEDDDTDLT